MRIVSLLPALTELVGMLGHASDLVGVSHECDVPAEVARLPRLTRGRIDPELPSATIDALVAAQHEDLYLLETDTLASLRPDVILTQAQCEVCAVSERTVRAFVAEALPDTRVHSAHPTDLAGVLSMFRDVATLLGEDAKRRAATWNARFEEVCGAIATSRGPVPRATLLLEWLDPPYTCGHWNPELVEIAGGHEVMSRPGARSRRCDWPELLARRPEVLVIAPCGRTLEQTRAEVDSLERSEWLELQNTANRIVLADGNAYFARPGPRLLQSVQIMAHAVNPEARCDEPGAGWVFFKR